MGITPKKRIKRQRSTFSFVSPKRKAPKHNHRATLDAGQSPNATARHAKAGSAGDEKPLGEGQAFEYEESLLPPLEPGGTLFDCEGTTDPPDSVLATSTPRVSLRELDEPDEPSPDEVGRLGGGWEGAVSEAGDSPELCATIASDGGFEVLLALPEDFTGIPVRLHVKRRGEISRSYETILTPGRAESVLFEASVLRLVLDHGWTAPPRGTIPAPYAEISEPPPDEDQGPVVLPQERPQ